MVFCISKEAFASQFDIYLALQCIFATIQCFMFLLILGRQNTKFFYFAFQTVLLQVGTVKESK